MDDSNSFSIKDLEKAIKYAKDKHVVSLRMTFDSRSRLMIQIVNPSDGSSCWITVFSMEAAKFPEITRTETLF